MTSSGPAASEAPAPLLRRAFDWWLVQVKHVLPPTVFFFFGFNLILFTRWMTLQEHGVPFDNFFAATLLALLVGKAVLVVDNLRLMHRFDGSPLVGGRGVARLVVVSVAALLVVPLLAVLRGALSPVVWVSLMPSSPTAKPFRRPRVRRHGLCRFDGPRLVACLRW